MKTVIWRGCRGNYEDGRGGFGMRVEGEDPGWETTRVGDGMVRVI